jgi:hypothetical protein
VKTGHPKDKQPRINNLSGGHCRILETKMLGIEPPIPADLGAAAGAVTRQLRITIPLCDLGADRPKDCAALTKLLKEKGEMTALSANSPSALGGNANDTITSASGVVTVEMEDLKEGEVPGPVWFEFMDINGSNDLTSKEGRYRYASLVQQGFSGNEFAAGSITDFTRLAVGDNHILQQVAARIVIDKFNQDRIKEAASRRVAPVDTAAGLSDFFPIIWPSRDQSGMAVPFGAIKFFSGGTTTNFRILAMQLGDMTDSDEEEVLIAVGYDDAAVKAVPKAARVPKTVRPLAAGHLQMSTRKRALLPKVYATLTAGDRKKKN